MSTLIERLCIGDQTALSEAADAIELMNAELVADAQAMTKATAGIRAVIAERDALRKDAERYRWLRSGDYSLALARSILNDTPHGIDRAIDAAMKEQA